MGFLDLLRMAMGWWSSEGGGAPAPTPAGRLISTVPVTLFARPSWSRTYLFDFARASELAAGERLALASVAATPAGLTIGTPAAAGAIVRVAVSGGAAGTVYTLTCSVVTSGGALLAQCGFLEVA